MYKRRFIKLLSLMLIFCFCSNLFGTIAWAKLTDGTPNNWPTVTGDSEVLFSEDFNTSLDTSAWNNYGGDSSRGTVSIDTKVHSLKYEQKQTGNQTGPQLTFKANDIVSWAGRTITISWKAYTDDDALHMRANYNSDGENAFYNPSSDMGENFKPGEWHEYSIDLLFTAEMTKRDFTLIFKIYNGNGGVESTYYLDNILITAGPAIPEIIENQLTKAVNTVPYEQTLKSNGSPPIKWMISSGELPSGLNLSESGLITGIPEITEDKTYNFTIQAENSLGTDEKEFNIMAMIEDNNFILAETIGKNIGDGNPLYTQRFGADPWGMEYNGRLYIYMTNDNFKLDGDGNILTNDYQNIQHINVISTDDMVNWTDHGSIPAAGTGGVASWAPASWAPAVIWKTIDGKDKFFLYYTPGGSGVVVLTADNPVGPWSDPLGKRLVDGSTPNCSGNVVPWCFDPAVFIDDKDGKAYLYFGGGIGGLDPANPKSARVVELGDDMISLIGTPVEIAPPYLFEDSGIHKYNDKYYFSYCSNFNSPGYQQGKRPGSGQIAYMVSDSPMGPFEYVDILFKSQAEFGFGGGNNHHAIFNFKGQWYLTYHGRTVTKAMGLSDNLNYRSTHIDKVTINEDGSIQQVIGTKKGIPQLQTFNPYNRVEAETIAWSGGIKATMKDPSQKTDTNLIITNIQNGSFISISQADFGDNKPNTFTASVSGKRGGIIEIRTGSPDPTDSSSNLIGSLTVPTGDGSTWTTETTTLTSTLSGTEDLFFVFKGNINNVDLFDFDWWQFGIEATTPEEETTPNTTEQATQSLVSNDEESTNNDNDKSWLKIAFGVIGMAAIAVGGLMIFRKKK